MLLLLGFSFLGGIVTIASPCILPVLPIVLSSSITGGKKRPIGVVTGFILSFTFFTLFLTSIVRLIGIPADSLRIFSVIVILLFGLSLLIPRIEQFFERISTKLSSFAPDSKSRSGFTGGLIVGVSIGLVWTPCVGPILASVISLALTGTVSGSAIFITASYAIGTAIPMLAIVYGGRGLLNRMPWLTKNTAKIQKGFGILMIITAIGIFFNLDRQFQQYILKKFPNYGTGLTSLEDNTSVKKQLKDINANNQGGGGIPSINLFGNNNIKAPEIIPGGVWFNLPPGKDNLKLEKLRGKVVLVDFWTYTCINCIRTLPYLRAWYDKYKDKGLVIIGVHTPEFEFEKDKDNLKKAIESYKLTYPIVQDNNYATWRAYNNHYWPAKYFIDKDGYIRYTHFGEGQYDESERVIQELLKEIGAQNISGNPSNPTYQVYSQTPETYLGYARVENFSSLESIAKDRLSSYRLPANLINNHVAFGGDWVVAEEYANPQAGAQLLFNFRAKEVYLVMRPKNGSASMLKVYLDGEPKYFGEDNKDGVVKVDSDRLYKLINLPSAGQHILKLEFLDSNCELFAFTFG